MTQVKTLPHEGAELKRKAGIVSGQLLLYQEMHLCRQGQAQPELNSRGWQSSGDFPWVWKELTAVGCEWAALVCFSPSLIFIFTCHWPGNISESVDTVPCSQLSQLLIARTEGGTALLEGFWGPCRSCVLSGMHQSTWRQLWDVSQGVQWALPAEHFSMAHFQGPCAVSHELKGTH